MYIANGEQHMNTLKQVIAQLESENKILPDSFGNGVISISLKEALEKYGDKEALRDGTVGVEIVLGPELFDNLTGFASCKR
jgi:hypothetical protein